ncbi:EamA family transporter [Halobacillus salinus]|uniref:EamA family transporter n=1 Tax=Halobacillus salinus TaxID=192814 RepID=UPI0020CA90EF|nr:DMT family transporter [Halobacillus salinus]
MVIIIAEGSVGSMKARGIVFVLLGAASFGFTPIFVKTSFAYGYSLGQVNIIQILIASLLLWSVSLVKGSDMRGMSLMSVLKVMAMGTTVGMTSILYYGAMQYITASLAIIFLFQFVWIGMIYEWILNKNRPTKVNLLALVITLTGVVFASGVIGGGEVELPLMGVILGLLSGTAYAGFIFFSGQVEVQAPPIMRSAWMVTGSLVLVSVVFYRDIPSLVVADSRFWLIGLGIALVGGVMPTLFFAIGSPLIPGRLANVLSSVELPVAIVSAMIILSESVQWVQWVGILLIIAAIFVNEFIGRE